MKMRAQNVWNSFRRDEKIALICCALTLSFLAGFARTPRKEAKPFFQNVAIESRKTVQVHVAGLVKKPGLYQLKDKTRVLDAVSLAGGALPDAALHRINLAAPLRDGQKIDVPPRSAALQPTTVVASQNAPRSTDAVFAVVNINTASAEQLETLPQIGPAMAARIIQYRQQHGAFQSLQDVDEVKGIGPKTLEKLRDKVSF